jgi:hypothetical protein
LVQVPRRRFDIDSLLINRGHDVHRRDWPPIAAVAGFRGQMGLKTETPRRLRRRRMCHRQLGTSSSASNRQSVRRWYICDLHESADQGDRPIERQLGSAGDLGRVIPSPQPCRVSRPRMRGECVRLGRVECATLSSERPHRRRAQPGEVRRVGRDQISLGGHMRADQPRDTLAEPRSTPAGPCFLVRHTAYGNHPRDVVQQRGHG